MRPSRVVVTFGGNTPFVYPTDYFQPNTVVQVVISGGATFYVEQTADDVQDTTVVPTWFPITGLGTSGAPLSANAFVTISTSAVRALRFTCLTSGSIAFIVLQGSGNDGVPVGEG